MQWVHQAVPLGIAQPIIMAAAETATVDAQNVPVVENQLRTAEKLRGAIYHPM